MPLAAMVLVLLGALIHALWNIAAKKAGSEPLLSSSVAVMILGEQLLGYSVLGIALGVMALALG
jgi:drug/metabolite transporter (DMT)-like permease